MNTKQERERRKAIWKAARWSLPIKTNEVEAADVARALAMEMERRNLAPWQTPPAAPALSALERSAIEDAEEWDRQYHSGGADIDRPEAVAARIKLSGSLRALRAARGGA